jgi:hypothetical protein
MKLLFVRPSLGDIIHRCRPWRLFAAWPAGLHPLPDMRQPNC